MKMLMEDWLRGCVHHDGRKGNVYLPIDKVLQIADYIQRTRTSGKDGFLYVPPWERVALTDIVRCKECKHWKDYECHCESASTDHEGGASYSLDRDANDYCSFGERSEE
jgi:hypothetical protein